jgi:hypothetical protein
VGQRGHDTLAHTSLLEPVLESITFTDFHAPPSQSGVEAINYWQFESLPHA